MESEQQGGLRGCDRNYALVARGIEFSVIGITNTINASISASRFLLDAASDGACVAGHLFRELLAGDQEDMRRYVNPLDTYDSVAPRVNIWE